MIRWRKIIISSVLVLLDICLLLLVIGFSNNYSHEVSFGNYLKASKTEITKQEALGRADITFKLHLKRYGQNASDFPPARVNVIDTGWEFDYYWEKEEEPCKDRAEIPFLIVYVHSYGSTGTAFKWRRCSPIR